MQVKNHQKNNVLLCVPHPPGVNIENNRAVKILNECFTIEYHERIEWADKNEKEKGVDIALAAQIMTTIYEEEDNTNLRIVIISGDTDFAPVVKKLMEPNKTGKIAKKNISVKVWGWMDNMSDNYVTYLEQLKQICSKKVLYYLDDYMYQICYTQNLERRWCISMAPANNVDEVISEWYQKLSHYTLAKHLIDSTEFHLHTTDFNIRTKNNRIIILFLTTEAREKFKRFSKEFYRIYYYEKLDQSEFDLRQWIQKRSATSQTNKLNHFKTELDQSTVNIEDDDDVIFQDS